MRYLLLEESYRWNERVSKRELLGVFCFRMVNLMLNVKKTRRPTLLTMMLMMAIVKSTCRMNKMRRKRKDGHPGKTL